VGIHVTTIRHKLFLGFAVVTVETFERSQVLHLNTEMVIKRGVVHSGGGYAERFFCILRDRWKNVRDCLSKRLWKHWL